MVSHTGASGPSFVREFCVSIGYSHRCVPPNEGRNDLESFTHRSTFGAGPRSRRVMARFCASPPSAFSFLRSSVTESPKISISSERTFDATHAFQTRTFYTCYASNPCPGPTGEDARRLRNCGRPADPADHRRRLLWWIWEQTLGRLRGPFERGIPGWDGEEDAFCTVSTKFSSCKVRLFIRRRVGPVSSLHDRACELFYTIKGGTGD